MLASNKRPPPPHPTPTQTPIAPTPNPPSTFHYDEGHQGGSTREFTYWLLSDNEIEIEME